MPVPHPFTFDPYAVDVQENPYPYYAVLRAFRGLSSMPVAVTRH